MPNQAFIIEQLPDPRLEPETSLEHDSVEIVLSSAFLATEMITIFCQLPRFVKCVPGSGHTLDRTAPSLTAFRMGLSMFPKRD